MAGVQNTPSTHPHCSTFRIPSYYCLSVHLLLIAGPGSIQPQPSVAPVGRPRRAWLQGRGREARPQRTLCVTAAAITQHAAWSWSGSKRGAMGFERGSALPSFNDPCGSLGRHASCGRMLALRAKCLPGSPGERACGLARPMPKVSMYNTNKQSQFRLSYL